MRYSRVNAILRSDNLLSRRLSKPSVAVCKPDQTSEDFPVEVVNVTKAIHEQGIDAYTMPKIEVIRIAHRLLVSGTQALPASVPDADADVVPPQTKVKVKRVKRAKTVKPVKRTKKPDKITKTKGRRRVPDPKTEATAEPRPAAVEPNTGAKTEDRLSLAQAPPKIPPAFVRPSIPYVVGVAILSLFQAILALLEPFLSQGDVDAKDLSQKINELIDEVHRRTVLPSSVKEESTTTTG